MSRDRIIVVTAGIMVSLFLASMESTVVATAMPTIVGQLGGLERPEEFERKVGEEQGIYIVDGKEPL